MAAPHEYPWKRRAGWWLRNPHYVLFELREVGGVLSAVYGLVLLYLLLQYQAGKGAYAAFVATMSTLPMLLLSLVILAFVVIHAVSWFMLIGKAQPIQFTKKPIPWQKAFAANLVVWAVVSVAVLFIIFGGL